MPNHSFVSSRKPQLTILGATDSASGSIHMLDTGERRILFDCGKSVGHQSAITRPKGLLKSHSFPFDPSSIDLVVLTHAHIDHCGSLPLLVKHGYCQEILCTPATFALLEVVLTDAARFQARDRAKERFNVGSGVSFDARDSFGFEEVDDTLDLCRSIEYGETSSPFPGVHLTLHDSAHVLGSCMCEVGFSCSGGEKHRFVFTGDLGRRNYPYLGNPSDVPQADVIVCESTYGSRTHEPFESTLERLANLINQTVARGGKILIPAFSLGRTNLLRCCLTDMRRSGTIPDIPIAIDSPLALDFHSVYERFCTNGSVKVDDVDEVEWLESVEEAWYRSTEREPSIIIASGGMCDGGRILDHLKRHIDDPRSSLILVSYQAPDSLGYQMMQATPTIRFHGRTWNKWIQVEHINGFSAHADQSDISYLMRHVSHEAKIRLVHGDATEKIALREHLHRLGYLNTEISERFDTVAF